MQHDPDHAEPGLVHPEVAAALGRLAELAVTRQPEEAVLPEFLERYYRELPEADLDDRRLDALYSVAVAHFGIGRQRRPGETLVRVVSPDTGLDESRPPRSLLFVVTDDAPFLVDTTRMVVERHRLDIHLMVHPMLDVARDADGVVTRVGSWRGTDRGVDAGRDRLLRRGGRGRGSKPMRSRRSPTSISSSTTSRRCATGWRRSPSTTRS